MNQLQRMKKKILGPHRARFRGKVNAHVSKATEHRRAIEHAEHRLAQSFPKFKLLTRAAVKGQLLDGDFARAQERARRQTNLGMERQQAIEQLFAARERIKTESKKRKEPIIGTARRLLAGPRTNLRLMRAKRAKK